MPVSELIRTDETGSPVPVDSESTAFEELVEALEAELPSDDDQDDPASELLELRLCCL